jgi:hypothetical protein
MADDELYCLQILLDNVDFIPDTALDDWNAWMDRYLQAKPGPYDASIRMAIQTIMCYKR